MQKTRLLLIEDEEDIAALIKLQAEIAGYKLCVEGDGLSGFAAIEREKPDLVLLDVMLPGENGLDVCRRIKAHPKLKGIPVILLSACSEELDMVLGLELGADDYICKPFSPKVLFSRIKATLRRKDSHPALPNEIVFGEFCLDLDRYLLRKNGGDIPITLSEFGILRRLLINRGQALSRAQLLEDVQHEDAFIIDRNIDVHMAAIRKKLGPNFDWIETVRGVGYRLREAVEAELVGSCCNK